MSGGERGATAAAGSAALLGHARALWHITSTADQIFNTPNDETLDNSNDLICKHIQFINLFSTHSLEYYQSRTFWAINFLEPSL